LKFDFNSIIKHDNKPIWLDPRQSCLAQPAFPVIRFRSPGAGIAAQPASCLPELDPNMPSVWCYKDEEAFVQEHEF